MKAWGKAWETACIATWTIFPHHNKAGLEGLD